MSAVNSERRPSWLLWVVGLVLLVVTAVGAGWVLNPLGAGHGPAAEPLNAYGATPLPGEGVICLGHVDVEGGVTPLHPLQPGRVETVVEEGAEVHKGDVLLTVDTRLAAMRVREAQADLEATSEKLRQAERLPVQHEAKVAQQKAVIAAAEFQLAASQNERKLKQKYLKAQQISAEELEAVEQMVNKLAAVVSLEKARLLELEQVLPETTVQALHHEKAARQARLEQAELAVKECVVKAPADGTVLRVQVSRGEVVGPQPRQPALLFCPRGERIIRAEVLQEWAGRVKQGQAVLVQDDAGSGATWTGKVKRVSDWFSHRRSMLLEPFQYNDVRTLECVVTLDSRGEGLRIGQRVRVKIQQGGLK
jgi:multidrug resistance efflux pump